MWLTLNYIEHEPWEVDERQRDHCWRVESQPDRNGRNVEAATRDPVGLGNDLLADVLKVDELFIARVLELAPFKVFLALVVARDLARFRRVQLHDKRPPCYDARAARQDVTAADCFEDG